MTLTDEDTRAVMHIAQQWAPVSAASLGPILRSMQCRTLTAGASLLHVGQPDPGEFFVLQGLLRTSVTDAQGREVTLRFHPGPGIVAPAITRMAQGRSRVDCVALEPTRVARFEVALLSQIMLQDPAMQRWGEAVLHTELMHQADREWALAALPALERLRLLRTHLPTIEDRAPHHMVASYLGVTPVTLSRLRAHLRTTPAA